MPMTLLIVTRGFLVVPWVSEAPGALGAGGLLGMVVEAVRKGGLFGGGLGVEVGELGRWK